MELFLRKLSDVVGPAHVLVDGDLSAWRID